MFKLDPQLAKDTLKLGEFPVSLVLLSRDVRFPWCILVPKRHGLREIYEMGSLDRTQFLEESCGLASAMQRLFKADKMNVANLGNVVSQLHIHHIARHVSDELWPKPVWGMLPALYDEAKLESWASLLQAELKLEV